MKRQQTVAAARCLVRETMPYTGSGSSRTKRCILWRNLTGRRSRRGMSHWSQLLYSMLRNDCIRRFSLSRFLCSPLEKTTLLPSDPSVEVQPLHGFPYFVDSGALARRFPQRLSATNGDPTRCLRLLRLRFLRSRPVGGAHIAILAEQNAAQTLAASLSGMLVPPSRTYRCDLSWTSATAASLSRPKRDPVHSDRVQAERHGDLAIRHLRVGFDELNDHRMRPCSIGTGHDLCLNHIRRLAK